MIPQPFLNSIRSPGQEGTALQPVMPLFCLPTEDGTISPNTLAQIPPLVPFVVLNTSNGGCGVAVKGANGQVMDTPVVVNAVRAELTEPRTVTVIKWPWGLVGTTSLIVGNQDGESLDAFAEFADATTLNVYRATDEAGDPVDMSKEELKALLDPFVESGELSEVMLGTGEDDVDLEETVESEVEGTAGTPGVAGWIGQIENAFVICTVTDLSGAQHNWYEI